MPNSNDFFVRPSEPATTQPALDAPIDVYDCAGNLYSDSIDHPSWGRFIRTLRAYFDAYGCWSYFDFIETVQFVESDYARVTYLDAAEDNRRTTCGFGF